ncbi:MAG: dihydroorotase family protein [Haloferacaceae archaeon]
MTVDTIVEGGRVVTPTDVAERSVAIDDGGIVAVGAADSLPDAREVVDASGAVVVPGVVDPHVHVDEVPENRAGTYEAETAAAALGGVTTFVDFAFQGRDRPATDPGAPLVDGIEHKRSRADRVHVDFGLHGVLRREERESLDELAAAVDAGVTSFKMFRSTYPIGVSNGFINAAFRRIADLDAVALVHTENPSVCEWETERLQRAGRGDPTDYPDSRPDYAEAMAAEDAARMAVETGVNYYGVHTTCRAAADVLESFQDDGSTVRAETCTHYTALTRAAHEEHGNYPLIAPPLRTADDRDAMFEHLERGTLSVVSTDHSVYHRSYKEVDDWWEAPFGANSIQYSLPVFHEVAVERRGYSLPFLVRTMCTNPARTFGMPEKGTLEPGTDADLVVLDPDGGSPVDAADNASNATFSIYDGFDVSAAVRDTFVRGQRVVADGELVGEPGDGRFLERDLPDWSV